MPHLIVSYDGTRNDRDALALGQLFAAAGAEVSLAYVRHAPERDPAREAAVQAEAEHMLAVAAKQLDGAGAGEHVVLNPSTSRGLAKLATELGADAIAFGSSYRTPQGQVALPHTAQQLLDGGAAWSLALAPAGLRREPVERSIGTVRVVDRDSDEAAVATAQSLAHALGAVVTDEEADLLVIPSRRDAPHGRLLLSAPGRERLNRARCPVLALPRGSALTFG
jgi:nucleotide-binding universal stress UspA family protein